MIEKQIPSAAVIEQIKEESKRFHSLMLEVSKIIVGQTDIVDAILIAILCDGHILLEGVPGVAKTTMVKAVAQALGLEFKRIQFTPDLLPSDLIGSLIFNQKTHEFETKKGPIFANLILADEINRAPAKVQAALLEGMQERQVTIGSTTYKLDTPFLVFATQNPIEQEGTYRLPEAQLDRFIFKLSIRYPAPHEEKEIIKRSVESLSISKVLHKEDINRAHGLVQQVYCDEKILDYIVNLVFATRMPANYKLAELAEFIENGVSPRATLALYNAAKANAFLKGRHFVTPDDVKAIIAWVLGHRISLTYHAEAVHMTPDTVIKKIVNSVPTP
ncbi:MAG TPA: MoxR family ATPase [Patescibacteria group bacterium]|nr:MoxR family ATPase [Patescibacteria group bacterium]